MLSTQQICATLQENVTTLTDDKDKIFALVDYIVHLTEPSLPWLTVLNRFNETGELYLPCSPMLNIGDKVVYYYLFNDGLCYFNVLWTIIGNQYNKQIAQFVRKNWL